MWPSVLEAVERRDVRVVERGEHARLALEARQALGVLRHLVEQELDRHLAAEPGVAGAVHRAHAALAERRHDLVGAQSGSSFEGQRGGILLGLREPTPRCARQEALRLLHRLPSRLRQLPQ